jgi:predicted small metal-binding protein
MRKGACASGLCAVEASQAKELISMRVATCPGCGKQIKAENDEELLKQGRQHAQEAHADQNLTDDQIKAIIAQSVHDE